MNNYYCWSNAKFFGGTIWPHVSCKCHVCHTPEVHVSFCIRWYWPQKCVVVNLPGIFWHSDFTLCSVQVYTWREFVSPNFHWFFMVMRYLFWCYDDGVLNALTILFALVLSTLLVIMLTNFSVVLYTTTRRRSFKKRHAGLVNSGYQPLHCIK